MQWLAFQGLTIYGKVKQLLFQTALQADTHLFKLTRIVQTVVQFWQQQTKGKEPSRQFPWTYQFPSPQTSSKEAEDALSINII